MSVCNTEGAVDLISVLGGYANTQVVTDDGRQLLPIPPQPVHTSFGRSDLPDIEETGDFPFYMALGPLVDKALKSVTTGPSSDALVAGSAAAGSLRGLSSIAGAIAPADAATQLVVTTPPPSSVVAGNPFGMVVTAEDASGNVDTSYNGSVTLTVDDGYQPLDGTTTVNAVKGVATFSGLTLDEAAPNPEDGSAEQLNVNANGLTGTSATVAVTAAQATQFLALPSSSNVVAGSPLTVSVYAVDSLFNPTATFNYDPNAYIDPTFNGNITLSAVGGPGGFGGTTTIQATDGVAAFSPLTLDQAGTYMLDATTPGETWPTLEQSTLTVTPAAATQLMVLPLSADLAKGEPFRIQVDAMDPDGNPDPTFNGKVTLALGANPGAATLGGKLTVSAVGGIATFNSLSISKPGSGYIASGDRRRSQYGNRTCLRR